jgi:hypothetical protein
MRSRLGIAISAGKLDLMNAARQRKKVSRFTTTSRFILSPRLRRRRGDHHHHVTSAEEAVQLILVNEGLAFLNRTGAWRIAQDGITNAAVG